MTEFLYDIVTERENILTDLGQEGEDLVELLDRIRDLPIEELDQEDKRKLVFVLLKQIQPYLSAANLTTNPKPAPGMEGGDDLNDILDNINVKENTYLP